MVSHSKLFFLFFILCIMVQDIYGRSSFVMRVLLDTLSENGSWVLESKHGFSAWDQSSPERIMKSNGKKCLLVRTKEGMLLCNNTQVMPRALCIAPKQGYMCVNGKEYHGLFLIVHSDKKTFLINCVDIEEYVFSVLKTESWPGWPLEVNKVFAIASRSYALSMALQARRIDQCYDIKNSNVHQTYHGVHHCKIIKKAVEQTRGVFLAYNKQPITAMFDCCCGGVVPAHIDDVDFVKAPYLARAYACHYCKSCSLYAWCCEYDISFLEEELSKIHGRIKRLRNIKVIRNDKAGLVKKIHVLNSTKHMELTGQQVYSLLKDVKSFYFKIQRKGNKIFFKGNGYGHHLGLCQWGARQMVREGYDYKFILMFYYPKTDFMKLVS